MLRKIVPVICLLTIVSCSRPEGEIRPSDEEQAFGLDWVVLDHCDLTLDGKTLEGIPVREASAALYRHCGWLYHRENPTPATGEVTLRYRFYSPDCLCSARPVLICKKADRWDVSVNGIPVPPLQGVHLLDDGNSCYDLGGRVQEGENVIALHRSPTTLFPEASPVLIAGEFNENNKVKPILYEQNRLLSCDAFLTV